MRMRMVADPRLAAVASALSVRPPARISRTLSRAIRILRARPRVDAAQLGAQARRPLGLCVSPLGHSGADWRLVRARVDAIWPDNHGSTRLHRLVSAFGKVRQILALTSRILGRNRVDCVRVELRAQPTDLLPSNRHFDLD
jgi:hypothetical protein